MRLRSGVGSRILRWLAVLTVTLAASACSTVRVAYDAGPTAAWWWLDGYADFSGEPASRVKDDIRAWFAWHRKAQLPGYAAWLAGTRAKVGDSITPAQVCRLGDEARHLLDPALDRALVAAAAWVPALGETQFRQMEKRYAKNLADARDDFLQPDAGKRHEAQVKRALERLEMLYGELDGAQLKLLSDGLKASPFDPEAWLVERQRRQKDILQTLRRLVAERADGERTLAALRGLAERGEHSPVPAYRAYQQRLLEHNCGLSARLHNAMKPAQRQALQARLQGWEGDLRALAAASPAAVVPQQAP